MKRLTFAAVLLATLSMIYCPAFADNQGGFFVPTDDLERQIEEVLSNNGSARLFDTDSEFHIYISPYFKADGWTGLGMTNLSSEDAEFLVQIYSANGTKITDHYGIIDAYGQTNFVVGADVNEDGWLLVGSRKRLACLCLAGTTGENNYMADIPMIELEPVYPDLVIPHVAYGPIFDTTIYISNANPSKIADVEIAYFNTDGYIAYPPIRVAIPASGATQIKLSDLTQNNMVSGGWVNVKGDSLITAFAIYNNLKSGGRSYAGLNAFSK